MLSNVLIRAKPHPSFSKAPYFMASANISIPGLENEDLATVTAIHSKRATNNDDNVQIAMKQLFFVSDC